MLTIDQSNNLTSQMGNGTVTAILERPFGLKVIMTEQGGQFWGTFLHHSGDDSIYESYHPGVPADPMLAVVEIAGEEVVGAVGLLAQTAPRPTMLTVTPPSVSVARGDIIKLRDRDGVDYEVRATQVNVNQSSGVQVDIQFI